MEKRRVRMIVKGKVQGVFYRDYVRIEAEKIGVLGFVRNLHDKTVEVVADGSEVQINKFIQACRKGSFLASVDDVKVADYNGDEEFEEFEIRF